MVLLLVFNVMFWLFLIAACNIGLWPFYYLVIGCIYSPSHTHTKPMSSVPLLVVMNICFVVTAVNMLLYTLWDMGNAFQQWCTQNCRMNLASMGRINSSMLKKTSILSWNIIHTETGNADHLKAAVNIFGTICNFFHSCPFYAGQWLSRLGHSNMVPIIFSKRYGEDAILDVKLSECHPDIIWTSRILRCLLIFKPKFAHFEPLQTWNTLNVTVSRSAWSNIKTTVSSFTWDHKMCCRHMVVIKIFNLHTTRNLDCKCLLQILWSAMSETDTRYIFLPVFFIRNMFHVNTHATV